MLAGPLYALTTGLAIFQGLLAFAYFKTKRCDPLEAGIISNPNQVKFFLLSFMFSLFTQHCSTIYLYVVNPGLFNLSYRFLN